MRKNNAGFTLVELIVAIAASTLVIAAALSFMLLGMRMEKVASDDASLQSDSRIIMRVLENIAAEGEIGEIKYSKAEGNAVKWELYESADAAAPDAPKPILSFNSENKTINGKDNVVIIENINKAEIRYENNLLSCDIETSSGDKYTSSVYCRVGVGKVTLAEIDTTEEIGKVEEALKVDDDITKEIPYRKALLSMMVSQYGSTGKIHYPSSDYHGLYYSQWYQLDWGRGTPWCAIFVSWCLDTIITASPVGADDVQTLSALVDNVMWYQFDREPSELAFDKKNNAKTLDDNTKELYDTLGEWKYPVYAKGEGEELELVEYIPNPGDLVFFENDDSNDRADHLGVVLYVEDGTVFTIEGNNENRVGVFSYPLIDTEMKSQHIIGYGVLDWQMMFPKGNWTDEVGTGTGN